MIEKETTAQTVERLSKEVAFYDRFIVDLLYYTLDDKHKIPASDNDMYNAIYFGIKRLHERIEFLKNR